MQTVDFWFDPLCPWAWISSRWLLEAAKVRELDPHFHVMSLGILNADKELDPQYMEFLKFAMAPVRVVTAARLEHGDDVVLPLYTALGTRFHPGKEERSLATIEKALTDVGLPTSLVDAAEVETYDDEVRRTHEDGINRVGMDVGTPVIAVEDTAFFGPVITPAPKGEAAGKLWDGVLLVAGTPGFYELKRTRDASPIFD
jgi:protein-disulfide isomerase-like protein with CxxC motif